MEKIELRSADQVLREGHTSKGNQPKWQQGNLWYKADHMGYEALAEVLASEMLKRSTATDFIVYEPVSIELDGKPTAGCVSRNFRADHEVLVPLERLHRMYAGRGLAKTLAGMETAEARLRYTVDFVVDTTHLDGFGRYLADMLWLDAFLLNEDRHTNNIAVVLDERIDTFRLCPYFDHGLSFLSDLNDYPLGDDLYACIAKVQAKPFAADFNEQADAASDLYGTGLRFRFTRAEVRDMILQSGALYSKEILDRAERVVLEQMRKYQALFSNLS